MKENEKRKIQIQNKLNKKKNNDKENNKNKIDVISPPNKKIKKESNGNKDKQKEYSNKTKYKSFSKSPTNNINISNHTPILKKEELDINKYTHTMNFKKISESNLDTDVILNQLEDDFKLIESITKEYDMEDTHLIMIDENENDFINLNLHDDE